MQLKALIRNGAKEGDTTATRNAELSARASARTHLALFMAGERCCERRHAYQFARWGRQTRDEGFGGRCDYGGHGLTYRGGTIRAG